MNIQIMQIVVDTTVDGPGWRTSIYCAGCRHACPGCHNAETWPFDAGTTMSVDEIMEQLRATDGNITFSGGDPMYQAEAFTELARRIRDELHRTIWCYTGFTYEQVLADPEMSRMLPYLEVLVTKGIAEIINAIEETREDLNPDLDIRGLLMVMSNDQTNATKEFKAYLGEKYQDYMFDAYTRRDTKMVEAQAMRKDIFEYARYCRVGQDYERFTKEIINSFNA